MAAIAIPLIGAVAPAIIDLIASLTHPKAIAVEQLGPGTGAVKFADVFVSVMADLVKAKAAEQIDALPAEGTVKTIIQSVVTAMKLSGLLGGIAAPVATTNPAEATENYTLSAGQSVLVRA